MKILAHSSPQQPLTSPSHSLLHKPIWKPKFLWRNRKLDQKLWLLLLEKARSYFSRKRAIRVNIHFPWNRFWILSQCEQTQSCCSAVRTATALPLLLARQIDDCPCLLSIASTGYTLCIGLIRRFKKKSHEMKIFSEMTSTNSRKALWVPDKSPHSGV